MSERCFRLPLDFESRTWFRALVAWEKETGSNSPVDAAVFRVVNLFRELSYAAENDALGFLPASLGGNLSLADLSLAGLEHCGLLKRTENPAGWQCDVFARLNPELDGEFVSEARKGGFARAAKIHLRNAAKESVDESGAQDLQPLFAGMDSQVVLQAMQLVKAVDHAYGRRARKPLEWTEGLKEDARRVREAFSEEAIEAVLAKVLQRRRDARMAGMPQSTEELLRNFETYAQG